MLYKKLKEGLSNNQLKIIAMIAMTFDHVGKELFPQCDIFSIIGRLAFPIFSYMIAEGCAYTKNKKKYFLQIFLLGLICQAVYFIAMGSLYQNVLITFSLSVITVFCADGFMKKKDFISAFLLLADIAAVIFLCFFLPDILKGFKIDYGFFGVLLPVAVYLMPTKYLKIAGMTAVLIPLAVSLGGVQWYSLAVIPLLLLYNGKRGKRRLKYLFYIFYPAHLAVIYLIGLIIDKMT